MRKHAWVLATTAAAALAASQASAQVSGGTPPTTASPAPVDGTPQTSTPADTSPTDASVGQSGRIEDIVVTAQRRSQNLQEVPIAVTAITSTSLAKTGVSDVLDLRVAVPSLNLNNNNGTLSTSLRGIGSIALAPGFENPVAIYVDGVYYASQASTFLGFNNIEQVEVLKGPQGTLFGRNATAGLIQVTTRTPGQEFEAQGDLSYGNYNTIKGTAYIGGGLANNVAADLAVQVTHQGDGWGRNLYTGKDIYRIDHDVALRSKLVFTPTDRTKIVIIGDYGDSRDSMNAAAALPGTISGFVPAAGIVPDRGYNVNNDTTNFKSGYQWGVSGQLTQKIGSLELISTTAYRKSRYDFQFDYDGGAAQPSDAIAFSQPDRQFSQELQLSGKDTRFNWVLGAYYFDAKSQYDPVNLSLADQGVNLNIRNTQLTKSIAGYAQGTYEIFDKTNLTLGLRYTSERREAVDGVTNVYVIPIATALPPMAAPDERATFNKLTFRVSLDHHFTDEVMGYASFNRGFKSGGFNTGSPGTDPFRPETVDAYEVGLKTDLFNRTARFNIAGFYYDYSDIQSQRLAGGVVAIVNAAAARIYGLEADFDVRITPELRLTTGGSYVDAKYTSYPDALLNTALGGTPSVVGSAKGNYLPLASKFTGNVGVDYAREYDFGKVDANVNLYYNNGFFWEADNALKQNDFAQLNATLTWTTSNGHFHVGIFGKNLTDIRVGTFRTTLANGTHLNEWAAPRTYGVTAGFRF